MRITERLMIDKVRGNLNASGTRLARLQQELASGRRISAASDDPSGAARAMRHRDDIAATLQFTRTAETAGSRLAAADGALGSLTDILQKARELALQGGNDTLGAEQRTAIAAVVNQQIHAAVQAGNARFAGQFIFAGTKTTAPPFTVGGPTPASVAYNGNTAAITLDVGEGANLRVDVPGDQVGLPVMNALIQLRDALTANDSAAISGGALTAIDAALDTVLEARGSVGARVNRLESLTQRLGDERVNLEGMQAQLEDIDFTDTVVKLTSARNVHEAALGAAAKAMQPSLVDFLR